MKKIIITIIAVCITTATLKAQESLLSSNGYKIDTIAGGTSIVSYLYTPIIKSLQKTLQIAFVVNKPSGVMNAGIATLEGSLDGINYYPINNDTLSIPNAAKVIASWKITDWSSLYARIKFVLSCSTESYAEALYLPRKTY